MQRRCRMADEKPMAETLETLATRITALGKSMDERFAQVDARFGEMDKRFGEMDARFTGVDDAIVEQREYTEFAFKHLQNEMKSGFSRLERKLDNALNTRTRTPNRRRGGR